MDKINSQFSLVHETMVKIKGSQNIAQKNDFRDRDFVSNAGKNDRNVFECLSVAYYKVCTSFNSVCRVNTKIDRRYIPESPKRVINVKMYA